MHFRDLPKLLYFQHLLKHLYYCSACLPGTSRMNLHRKVVVRCVHSTSDQANPSRICVTLLRGANPDNSLSSGGNLHCS